MAPLASAQRRGAVKYMTNKEEIASRRRRIPIGTVIALHNREQPSSPRGRELRDDRDLRQAITPSPGTRAMLALADHRAV